MCDSRVVDISDLYRYYAFRSIKVTVMRTGDEHAGCALVMGGTITPPTVLADCLCIENAFFQWSTELVPVSQTYSGSVLKGNVAWWMTQAVGDPELDTQGNLVLFTFAGSPPACTASTVQVLYEYEIDFHERLPAAVSVSKFKERSNVIGDVDTEGDFLNVKLPHVEVEEKTPVLRSSSVTSKRSLGSKG
jgi:hypothetical protein